MNKPNFEKGQLVRIKSSLESCYRNGDQIVFVTTEEGAMVLIIDKKEKQEPFVDEQYLVYIPDIKSKIWFFADCLVAINE